METTIENVKLKMWEKTDLPETNLNNGIRVKTGNKVEFTTYTFVDEWGSKLVFLTKSDRFRVLEGETGNLTLKIELDDFGGRRKWKVSLVDFK